jgi:hypothetical protein
VKVLIQAEFVDMFTFFNAIHPVVFGTIYFIDFITVKTQQSLATRNSKTLLCFDGNKIDKV